MIKSIGKGGRKMKEKLQTRQMWKWLLVIAVLMAGVLGMSVHTQAATQKYPLKLQQGKTYSTKLTGSNTYKIKWKGVSDSKNNKYYVDLYINSKKFRKSLKYEFYSVELLKADKSRVLINVGSGCDGSREHNIYEYKNGKLQLMFNACREIQHNNVFDKLPGDIYNIGNNKFAMDWRISYQNDKDQSTTYYVAKVIYHVGKDKITTLGSTFPVYENTWLTARKIKTYTAAGGKTTSFTAEKGSKVTILKVTLKKGVSYLQIENSKGKKGWFKVSKGVGYFTYE